MQLVTEAPLATPLVKPALNDISAAEDARYAQYKVIRRNGSVVVFEPAKISIAVTKAFIAVNGGQGAASARVREQVGILTQNAVAALLRRQPSGGTFHIEDIQDQVELALMRAGEHNVARAYVLYREERAKERAREVAARSVSHASSAGHVTAAAEQQGAATQQMAAATSARVVSGEGSEKPVAAATKSG